MSTANTSPKSFSTQDADPRSFFALVAAEFYSQHEVVKNFVQLLDLYRHRWISETVFAAVAFRLFHASPSVVRALESFLSPNLRNWLASRITAMDGSNRNAAKTLLLKVKQYFGAEKTVFLGFVALLKKLRQSSVSHEKVVEEMSTLVRDEKLCREVADFIVEANSRPQSVLSSVEEKEMAEVESCNLEIWLDGVYRARILAHRQVPPAPVSETTSRGFGAAVMQSIGQMFSNSLSAIKPMPQKSLYVSDRQLSRARKDSDTKENEKLVKAKEDSAEPGWLFRIQAELGLFVRSPSSAVVPNVLPKKQLVYSPTDEPYRAARLSQRGGLLHKLVYLSLSELKAKKVQKFPVEEESEEDLILAERVAFASFDSGVKQRLGEVNIPAHYHQFLVNLLEVYDREVAAVRNQVTKTLFLFTVGLLTRVEVVLLLKTLFEFVDSFLPDRLFADIPFSEVKLLAKVFPVKITYLEFIDEHLFRPSAYKKVSPSYMTVVHSFREKRLSLHTDPVFENQGRFVSRSIGRERKQGLANEEFFIFEEKLVEADVRLCRLRELVQRITAFLLGDASLSFNNQLLAEIKTMYKEKTKLLLQKLNRENLDTVRILLLRCNQKVGSLLAYKKRVFLEQKDFSPKLSKTLPIEATVSNKRIEELNPEEIVSFHRRGRKRKKRAFEEGDSEEYVNNKRIKNI